MNAEFDPLEAELRSLRARDPSPELQQRIAAALSSSPISPRSVWSMQPKSRFVLAASALAASVLAIALFIRQDTRQTTHVSPPLAESPAATAFDAALPSVWQFHHALNQSTTDLDTLLDQHAARPQAPAISLVQIRGFGHSSSNLESLLGVP
jgi:hypothetical protein